MTAKQDKIIRLIAGTLYAAGLSYRELIEVSDRLIFDRLWLDQLSQTIRRLAETDRQDAKSHIVSPKKTAPTRKGTYVAQILHLLRQKRLRKTIALSLLAKVSQAEQINWTGSQSLTLRRNVENLVDILSPSQSKIVIARLSDVLGVSRDAYLRELL